MRYLSTLVSITCAALVVVSVSGCTQPSQFESKAQALDKNETGLDQAATRSSAFETAPQPLGNGTVRTYIKLDAQNHPQEVGVIFTEAALTNLTDQSSEIVLPLPPQAANTVLNHIGLNWNPHGHAPDPIYGNPHFDIHFYTLTPEERASIEGADLEKAYVTPDADLIPTGYVLAPDSAEPRMGAHWVDPTSEEFQGAPNGFSRTMLYGFYNGKTAFIEPMITLDFLNSKQDFESAIAVPQRYSQVGAYPTGYRVTYNEATKEHIVTLTGFTRSQPQR